MMTKAERKLLKRYEKIAKAKGITVRQALREAAGTKAPLFTIMGRY